jgi:hypothetical protein
VLQRHDVIRAVILAGTKNLIKLLVHKGIAFVVLGNNVVGKQQDLKNNDVVCFPSLPPPVCSYLSLCRQPPLRRLERFPVS